MSNPIIKWVGGKRGLLRSIRPLLPAEVSTLNYYEPFVGGGAVFLDIGARFKSTTISDSNTALIAMYRLIQLDVEHLIDSVQKLFSTHNSEQYNTIRRQLNIESDAIQRAVYFLYLNKTCFKGLYRVNKKNEFNNGIGERVYPFNLEDMREAASRLQSTTILQGDFGQVPIRSGGFYYIDPPYHKTNVRYSTTDFNEDSHLRLKAYCDEIAGVGSKFILSNSNTEFTRELYSEYTIQFTTVAETMPTDSSSSRRSEILVKNF